MKKRFFICLLFCLSVSGTLKAQEALKTAEEAYYDFLSLRGSAERSYLNYRTLSDSVWNVDENVPHPWRGKNLGVRRNVSGGIFLRIYGPELFSSYNAAAPYGQNDGALWQGRGLNASVSGGVRFEAYGAELSLKPHLAFSQNLEFDFVQPAYSGANFAGKAEKYGYYGIPSIDFPQRFGDEPFFTYDWGDSEIRYTWKTLTAGFGTQAIWLGPSYLNSMLHSNNAPAYPKFDIGLRRQRITLPWLDWYLGDVEARLWVGRLSESDYFDNDASNNYTMIHGMALAYGPSFLPGLTLFANRVCLVDWSWENLKYIIPSTENNEEDQKASFGFSWLFPGVGLEIYGELGVDDYVANDTAYYIFPLGYIRYPFHTMVYTVGLKKVVPVAKARDVYGVLFFEWNLMEMSQDFQFQWPYSIYSHHQIIHGYTNKGQLLGAGTGWGGSSQYFEFKLYYPKGSSSLFVHRSNPDNNFIYREAVNSSAGSEPASKFLRSLKADLAIGIGTNYFLTDTFSLNGGIAYNLMVNPYYYFNKTDYGKNEFKSNVSFNLGVKWNV